MSLTTIDLDTADAALLLRLGEIEEEIADLSKDVPGDPGLYRWPPYLERAFEELLREQHEISVQRRTLARVRAQRGVLA